MQHCFKSIWLIIINFSLKTITDRPQLGLPLMMWVPSIVPCMLSNPHHYSKFSITPFISTPINHAINFLQMRFIDAINSCNIFETINLLITKNSLHTKRLIPWANLYITHNTYISIGITCQTWCLVSIVQVVVNQVCKKDKSLSFKNFQPICHRHIQ